VDAVLTPRVAESVSESDFCPTPEVQLHHFSHETPKSGISVEVIQFLLTLLLKQRILAVYHHFHSLLVATKLLTAKLHLLYEGVGVAVRCRSRQIFGGGNDFARISPKLPEKFLCDFCL